MRFFIVIFLASLFSFEAQELRLEKDWQMSLKGLQENHETLLEKNLSQGTHRIVMSLLGQVAENKIQNTMVHWSVYESDKSFSAYCHVGDKQWIIQGNIKGGTLNLVWKIVEKGQEKVLGCTLLHSQNDFAIHLKKNAEIQNSGDFLSSLLERASDWRKALESQAIKSIANLSILFMQKLDNPKSLATRDVEEKWGKFFVGNYSKSLKLGNGKVLNFHLLIYGGSGALRHEIIGGYLFLTAIVGSWEGEYWLWQEV